MKKIAAYAAHSATTPLVPFTFERRSLLPYDVQIEILYCGVCHTDLHFVRNEWKNTIYPVVPGHEIVGRVSQVGSKVAHFKVGSLAAVGCMVDSCRTCPSCKEHLEQYCEKGSTFTYNSWDSEKKQPTFGGYSTEIIVHEDFVLHVPEAFSKSELSGVAPLLCAGITTYSPLKHWNVGPKSKIGVVGLGGLGHMALKIAHALGAHVTLFTTSQEKVQDGYRLGADEVILSKNDEEMAKKEACLDFILDTVPAPHDLNMYTKLLKRDGTLCLVGLPPNLPPPIAVSELIHHRRQLAGSLIGGIQETQQMLEFCAKHHIISDIELIPIQKINEAYERLVKNDVHYRFVIDIGSLHSS